MLPETLHGSSQRVCECPSWSLEVYIMWCPATTWPAGIAGDYISLSDQIRRQAPELCDFFAFWLLTPAQPLRGVFGETDPTDGLATFQLGWAVCPADVKAAMAVLKCKFCLIISSVWLIVLSFSQRASLKSDRCSERCVPHIQMGCGRLQLAETTVLFLIFLHLNLKCQMTSDKIFSEKTPWVTSIRFWCGPLVRSTNNILSCSRLHWPLLVWTHTNILQTVENSEV